MSLKPVDPRITAKLLEGHQDVISGLAAEREKFYQHQSCPYCQGNSFRKIGDGRTLFRAGEPLPRYQLHCLDCGCEFDPFSGIVLTIGNLAKAFEPVVPLINKD
jgi:hypothetical protein